MADEKDGTMGSWKVVRMGVMWAVWMADAMVVWKAALKAVMWAWRLVASSADATVLIKVDRLVAEKAAWLALWWADNWDNSMVGRMAGRWAQPMVGKLEVC